MSLKIERLKKMQMAICESTIDLLMDNNFVLEWANTMIQGFAYR